MSSGRLKIGPVITTRTETAMNQPNASSQNSTASINQASQGETQMNVSLINTEIKPFKAMAYHKGKFVELTEASLKGKWSVVFFYPADFTFVCPTELGDLADNYAEFRKLGVEIYSVSTDTHFTHMAWHDSSETIGKIEYPMIGDPTGSITRNFGVMIEEAGLAERGTFVMDPQGRIQIIEINAGGIGRNAEELLRKIKAAQYVAAHPGEVCPAKWKEGEATLAPSLELVGKI
jgi:peroxiredoxin (alkyl hydroperoxide reductase subunit C)